MSQSYKFTKTEIALLQDALSKYSCSAEQYSTYNDLVGYFSAAMNVNVVEFSLYKILCGPVDSSLKGYKEVYSYISDYIDTLETDEDYCLAVNVKNTDELSLLSNKEIQRRCAKTLDSYTNTFICCSDGIYTVVFGGSIIKSLYKRDYSKSLLDMQNHLDIISKINEKYSIDF